MEEPRIDKTIYTGRPEDPSGRLEKEIQLPYLPDFLLRTFPVH